MGPGASGCTVALSPLAGTGTAPRTDHGGTSAGDFIGAGCTLPSNGSGVLLEGGSGSTVGGPEAADRNVISNNGAIIGSGVDVSGATAALIQGNYIGTDATGNAGLGNDEGIAIFGGATNNVVSGNVISGNFGAGVRFLDVGTAGNS